MKFGEDGLGFSCRFALYTHAVGSHIVHVLGNRHDSRVRGRFNDRSQLQASMVIRRNIVLQCQLSAIIRLTKYR